MQVTVQNHQKRIPINPAKIKTLVKKILLREGVRKGFLSLTFVTDRKIQSLNKQFLNRNHTTDVLAFDLRERPQKTTIQGDVVISTITAVRNAKAYQNPVEKEILLYIVHGILHLLGYDDHRSADVKKMRRKEDQVLSYLEKKPARTQ